MSGQAVRALVLCLLVLSAVLSGCAGKHGSGSSSEAYGNLCSNMPLSSDELAVLDGMSDRISASVPARGRRAVAAEYARILREKRRGVGIVAHRSEKFVGYAREVFRSHGLPEQLAYLAIVESGFNPVARSRAGAAGAWQFVPSTGRKYGLAQDTWLDERLDVYESTEAAADYLKALYERFGDWPTAIAAYNAGEGKMGRACAAAGRPTFFGVLERNHSLDDSLRLKEETCRYVPRFLATVAIMENLERLGFEPIQRDMVAQETRLRIPPATDLQAMARACGMSWQEFTALNPHHRAAVSSPLAPTYAYVPHRARMLAMAFVNRPVIASQRAVADARRAAPSRARRAAAAAGAGAGTGYYRVVRGDTLYSVARRHSTSVGALMAANGISDPSQVCVGQTLRLPGAPRPAAAKKGSAYHVQANDNLWRISQKTGVSVAELKRLNNLGDEPIYAGQRLVVQ